MRQSKLLTTVVFTGSLLLGSLGASPSVQAQGGPCNAGNFPNKITISVTDDNGAAVTRVSPYEVSFPDMRGKGGRTGNAKVILICLDTGVEFTTGNQIVWEQGNLPPRGEFTEHSSDQKWYILTNANSKAGTYTFTVTVNTPFGIMVIDPRVQNGGGGHTN